VAAPGAPCVAKYSAQLASTEDGSAAKRSYISSSSQSFAPKSLSSVPLDAVLDVPGAMATVAFFRCFDSPCVQRV